MGKGLDLDAISARTGLSPTHMHHLGELTKQGDTYEQDMWTLNSPLGKKEELEVHLAWLDQQLRSHYDYLRSLKSQAKLDVFCSYTSEGDQAGFSLSPEALAIFSEVGIKLELSLISLEKKRPLRGKSKPTIK